MFKTLYFFLLLVTTHWAQTHTIEGMIIDAETSQSLSYASVRIDKTTQGTAANNEGRFILKLKPGTYKLLFSYIGYKSDTLVISVPLKEIISVRLLPDAVRLPEVVVSAEEDPAYRIIREAIKRKKENRRGLRNIEYNAYAKTIMLSAGEVAMIEETFLKGYSKINDWEKEFILSRHKTENIQKETHSMDFNISDKYYIDFSADTLSLLMNTVYLPLAENAFDYYDYKLLKITEAAESEIYQIQVIPRSKIQPLLMGEITIESDMFALNSARLETNPGVRFPFINNLTIKFLQQLGKYDRYWLPNYVETTASLDFSLQGLLTIETMSFNQINSITEYKLNAPIPDSITNAVKSKYGFYTADTSGNEAKPNELLRDDIAALRPIPLTAHEDTAYSKLDSTMSIEKMVKVGGALSAFIPEPGSDLDTTSSPIWSTLGYIVEYGLFRNNRVSGIVLGGKFDSELISRKLFINTEAGYSLHRKNPEGRFNVSFSPKKFFISEIQASIFHYSKSWNSLSPYSALVNTAGVSLGFEDQFNYLLSTGFNLGITKNFRKSISARISLTSERQKALIENIYRSIFNPNRFVRKNPEIIEGSDNKVTLDLSLGENPLELQVTPKNGAIISFDFSNPYFNSRFNYKKVRIVGTLNLDTFYDELFISPYLQINIDGAIIRGEFGPQHIFSPNTALGFYAPAGVMRGISPYEFAGTEMITLNLEHNWRTTPWQALGLKFIYDAHIDLITGVSGLKTWDKSNYSIGAIMDKPYWEAYISLSRLLAALRIDFVYNSQKEFTVRSGIAVIF